MVRPSRAGTLLVRARAEYRRCEFEMPDLGVTGEFHQRPAHWTYQIGSVGNGSDRRVTQITPAPPPLDAGQGLCTFSRSTSHPQAFGLRNYLRPWTGQIR
ncbi:hypothetical protein PSAB6_30406 [Paraburkholderia sabiae]|nr:hypothetical protein PSAB6_30406 [Paraburkholderia sabiae]